MKLSILCKIVTGILLFSGRGEAQAPTNCVRPPNWVPINVTKRIEAVPNIASVKILSIKNRQPQQYGEIYDVEVELLCSIKANRGIIFPPGFTIKYMGARPTPCPSMDVEEGQNYIIFLERESTDAFTPLEYNQEQALWEYNYDNLQPFAGQLNHCYLPTGCVNLPDSWLPVAEVERAKLAQIVVKVKVLNIHYYSVQKEQYIAECELQCNMKQPQNIAPLPGYFNVTSLGVFEGQCAEKLVTANHEFIMFLETRYALPPLLDATVPPELIESYILGPQEVNSEQAVFNVTDEILGTFSDYLQRCSGMSSFMGGSWFSCLLAVLFGLMLLT
ncbi:unnamed protein product [Clavelina lepadiformis]|uniref:Uncharacterized protein n=1 Tax=Clavelina lepadiformis TaxID=159417 RepID=A0ABP0FP72_CLALP